MGRMEERTERIVLCLPKKARSFEMIILVDAGDSGTDEEVAHRIDLSLAKGCYHSSRK
jgi:hypothetical protein